MGLYIILNYTFACRPTHLKECNSYVLFMMFSLYYHLYFFAHTVIISLIDIVDKNKVTAL